MPHDTHNPLDAIQRTELVPDHRQGIQQRQSRRIGSPFDRNLRSQLARGRHLPVAKRQDAAEIEQITGQHGRNITRHRFRRSGQFDPERFQRRIDRHR